MSRIYILIVLLTLVSSSAKSQDLIVTTEEDSLNCKITKIRSDFIFFTFKYNNEIRNTLVPRGKVKFFRKGYYPIPEIPNDQLKNLNVDDQDFRIGVYGGFSYMTAKLSNNIPASLTDYVNDLRTGYHLGGDLTFFVSENIGVGARYSMFRTANDPVVIYTVDARTGQIIYGLLRDDITMHFFGPTVCTRVSSANKKTHIISNFSVGYLAYRNEATLINDFTLTGSTAGLMCDIGVDVNIAKNLALGVVFAYKLGTLNQYNYQDANQRRTIKLDKDNLESISRIDISLGLRWIK